MHRREFMRLLALSAAVPTLGAASAPVIDLDRVSHDLFLYFRERTLTQGPLAGLTPDRVANFEGERQAHSNYDMLSIAATGLALAAMVIGARRGWISSTEARTAALRTLRTVQQLPSVHGWQYHFFDARNGEPMPWSEVSTIDTGTFLLGGVLAAGEYFGGEVQHRAQQIFDAIDWNWALTDGGARPQSQTLTMGWNPQQPGHAGGFIRARWDSYTSELLLLYLLGMGARKPLPAACWQAWKRPRVHCAGGDTFAIGPLFTHYTSHVWVDLRGRRDRLGCDYWKAAQVAVACNRQFCLDHAEYQSLWGISATDTPTGGYDAYSAPPGEVHADGTIDPQSVVAAVMLRPDFALPTLAALRAWKAPAVYGRYSFTTAFNPAQRWRSPDLIGIDAGMGLLALENHRSGLIWKLMERVPALRRGLHAAGMA